MNIVGMPAALKDGQFNFSLFDDFLWYISPHLWTSLVADSGTSAAVTAGAPGGVVALGTGATDNNEAEVYTTTAAFKPAVNKPLYVEGLVQFAEANTDDANVAFGLASAPGANLIVDDGAGLRASGTVVALYKVDGETVWRFVTRNGSAATVSQSTTPAGGAAYQRLGIEVVDAGPGMSPTVVPTVDDQHLRDATTNAVVRHSLDLTSIAAASLFAAVKAGGANAETLSIDYLAAAQVR